LEIKHNSVRTPENSGTSAQILAALRAEKLRRTPSTIIERRRAAKALSASRIAAKVALDKLEARAAALAEDRFVDLRAANLLDHARNQGSNLEMALEDFRGENELTGEIGERVLSRAYDIDAEVA
tara:strand:- start:498 stop:872 length:375 start_codon:yes stop_codon:yes gene_type:complete